MEYATKIYCWLLRALSVLLICTALSHAQAVSVAALKTDIALASYNGEKSSVKPMPVTDGAIDRRINRAVYITAGTALCLVGMWGWSQDRNYGLLTGTYFFVKGGICFYKAAF